MLGGIERVVSMENGEKDSEKYERHLPHPTSHTIIS